MRGESDAELELYHPGTHSGLVALIFDYGEFGYDEEAYPLMEVVFHRYFTLHEPIAVQQFAAQEHDLFTDLVYGSENDSLSQKLSAQALRADIRHIPAIRAYFLAAAKQRGFFLNEEQEELLRGCSLRDWPSYTDEDSEDEFEMHGDLGDLLEPEDESYIQDVSYLKVGYTTVPVACKEIYIDSLVNEGFNVVYVRERSFYETYDLDEEFRKFLFEEDRVLDSLYDQSLQNNLSAKSEVFAPLHQDILFDTSVMKIQKYVSLYKRNDLSMDFLVQNVMWEFACSPLDEVELCLAFSSVFNTDIDDLAEDFYQLRVMYDSPEPNSWDVKYAEMKGVLRDIIENDYTILNP